MTRARSSPLLRAVDSLCEELQHRCGLTRFSIVIDRPSGPLTVTLQAHGPSHTATPVARLELELRDGERRLGRVLLEDAFVSKYPDELRRAADDVLAKHIAALRDALPA